MTEREWLACADPRPMIGFLRTKFSNRKARLFAAACCRLVAHLFSDTGSLHAVEVAEQFSDGLASDDKRDGAWAGVGERVSLSERSRDASWWADSAAESSVLWSYPQDAYYKCAALVSREVIRAEPQSLSIQLALFRCIVGNPFRPLSVVPMWLAWNDGTVVKLSQSIYDNRTFDRLPLLADALEEAGCHNADILTHCRSEGPHVRGCWVIDLLLGKE